MKDPVDKISRLILVVLEFCTLGMFIITLRDKRYFDVFLCVCTSILLTFPLLISSKSKMYLPGLFRTILYFFIFNSIIMGEVNGLFVKVENWDNLQHFTSAFILTAFFLYYLEGKLDPKENKLSNLFMSFLTFSVVMLIGVLWEFIEYGADVTFKTDMQKDYIINEIHSATPDKEGKRINATGIYKTALYDKDGKLIKTIEGGYLDVGIKDTMKDFFVNGLGSLAFLLLVMSGNKKQNDNKIANLFSPKRKKISN